LKAFRLTLDGQNFTDPVEWREFSIAKTWNDDVLLETAQLSYTFIKDAYDYILSVYEQGFCAQIDAKVYIRGTLRFRGKIFLSDIEIDRIKQTISATISNEDYNSYIKNKARQQYILDVGRASNGLAIPACVPVATAFHAVSDGSYYADDRNVYDAYDVLEFLVAAMSDGNMAFESEFFSTGNGYGDTFTTGREIRMPDPLNTAPALSWEDAYGSLKKIWNLGIAIIDDNGTPTLKVEPYSFFRNFGVSERFDDLNTLTESVDTGQLYSVINIGSPQARRFDQDIPNTLYPPGPYKTWESETYNISGTCVVENELDLTVTAIVIDSNSIENQLINPDFWGQTDAEATNILTDFTAGFGYTTDYRATNVDTGDEDRKSVV
jgi:hypothetical protein